MRILEKNELHQIVGGVSISGTVINSLVRGLNAFLDFGRSLGTAIRRLISGGICPL